MTDSSRQNVLVCGAPRSGTSMMTQVLVDAGLNPGGGLIAGSRANPNGFFESIMINRANDELLQAATLRRDTIRPPRSLSWLGSFEPTDGPGDHLTMSTLLPSRPFVVKDPRFSFTYPAWRDLLGDHLVIVMVRPAAEVHDSLQAMATAQPAQFEGCDLTVRSVQDLWSATYDAISAWAGTSTIYVSDSTLRDRSVLPELSVRVGRRLDAPNIEPRLQRSTVATPSRTDQPVLARCWSPTL